MPSRMDRMFGMLISVGETNRAGSRRVRADIGAVTKPKQSIRTSGGSVTDRRMVKEAAHQ
jgi:hypothetical protein